VMDDPLAKDPSYPPPRRANEGSSSLESPEASWPTPKPLQRAGSKGGKPGSRTYRGRKR
jgi:excinuclease ABC subunit B